MTNVFKNDNGRVYNVLATLEFNEADKNNELIIDLASGVPSVMKAEAMPEAGLAGMLQGSPYKQKKAFDFIIDGDKEITLHVNK